MAEGDGLVVGEKVAGGTAAQLTSTAQVITAVSVKSLVTSAGTVYVGPAGVTSADGYPLAANESVEFDIIDPSKIYIVGSGTVRWMGLVP